MYATPSLFKVPSVGSTIGERNLALQQPLGGAGRLQLFEPPLQNQLPHIAEGPPFPRGEPLELGSQFPANSQTERCFPFPHRTLAYVRLDK